MTVLYDDDVADFGFQIRDNDATGQIAKADYTLTASIKDVAADGNADAVWTLTITDKVDDATLDEDILRVVFSLDSTVVSALGIGSFVWDLQVDGPTGRWTPINGTLAVVQDVTRNGD